jgi:hypothetical protein
MILGVGGGAARFKSDASFHAAADAATPCPGTGAIGKIAGRAESAERGADVDQRDVESDMSALRRIIMRDACLLHRT